MYCDIERYIYINTWELCHWWPGSFVASEHSHLWNFRHSVNESKMVAATDSVVGYYIDVCIIVVVVINVLFAIFAVSSCLTCIYCMYTYIEIYIAQKG